MKKNSNVTLQLEYRTKVWSKISEPHYSIKSLGKGLTKSVGQSDRRRDECAGTIAGDADVQNGFGASINIKIREFCKEF